MVKKWPALMEFPSSLGWKWLNCWALAYVVVYKFINISKPLYPSIFRVSSSVPLQAWRGPEGSRKLRFPDFMTTAQEGGKVFSLTHRPHLHPGKFSGYSPGKWKVSVSGGGLPTLRRNLMLPDSSGVDGSDSLPDVCQLHPEYTVLTFQKTENS